MKTLLVQIHDLTILVQAPCTLNSQESMVRRSADRVLGIDPEMAPAEFVARLISELVVDARLPEVHVMARFEPKKDTDSGLLDINFECGFLKVRRLK